MAMVRHYERVVNTSFSGSRKAATAAVGLALAATIR
jgi:hypothetical protein